MAAAWLFEDEVKPETDALLDELAEGSPSPLGELTTYDAAYLELALRREFALATQDGRSFGRLAA